MIFKTKKFSLNKIFCLIVDFQKNNLLKIELTALQVCIESSSPNLNNGKGNTPYRQRKGGGASDVIMEKVGEENDGETKQNPSRPDNLSINQNTNNVMSYKKKGEENEVNIRVDRPAYTVKRLRENNSFQAMEEKSEYNYILFLFFISIRPFGMKNSCTKLKVNKPCYWPKIVNEL